MRYQFFVHSEDDSVGGFTAVNRYTCSINVFGLKSFFFLNDVLLR